SAAVAFLIWGAAFLVLIWSASFVDNEGINGERGECKDW
ncbi:hypothetical protein Tco_1124700, partial [Tanacetum coccineum]